MGKIQDEMPKPKLFSHLRRSLIVVTLLILSISISFGIAAALTPEEEEEPWYDGPHPTPPPPPDTSSQKSSKLSRSSMSASSVSASSITEYKFTVELTSAYVRNDYDTGRCGDWRFKIWDNDDWEFVADSGEQENCGYERSYFSAKYSKTKSSGIWFIFFAGEYDWYGVDFSEWSNWHQAETCTSKTTKTYDDDGPKRDGEINFYYTVTCEPIISDTTDPGIDSLSGPSSPTSNNDPSFSWTCSESGCNYKYKLDSGSWSGWTTSSTKSYSNLDDGSHKFYVKAKDAAGNTGSYTSHSWTIDTNRDPVINSLTANPSTVLPSGYSTVTADATDEDGDQLTYTWTADYGYFTGSGYEVTWHSQGAVGTYTITVEVDDNKGGVATESVSVDVQIPIEQLIKDYFPYYLFSSGEDYYPTSFYFDNDFDVENNDESYIARSGVWERPYVYVNDVEDDRYLSIQYWLYYPNNPWGGILFSHEHDWEHVKVIFDKSDLTSPIEVKYYYHDSDSIQSWGDVTKIDNSPYVFVANGSHASYWSTGALIPVDEWESDSTLDLSDFNVIWVTDEFYGRFTRNGNTFDYRIFGTIQGAPQPEPLGGAWPRNFIGAEGLWYEFKGHGGYYTAPWRKVAWTETRSSPPEDAVFRELLRDTFVLGVVGPVDLHIYDPLGRHVGINYEDGVPEEQISGSEFYSDEEGQLIVVPRPIEGGYRVEIVGAEEGNYDFAGIRFDEDVSIIYWREDFDIPIDQGEEHSYVETFTAVEARVDPALASLEPGKTTSYTATIRNYGTLRDSYNITVLGLDEDWYTLYPASVTIDPRERATVTLKVTPPRTSETRPGVYNFTIFATSLSNPAISGNASANVKVLPFREVAMELAPAIIEVEPPSTAIYTVTLQNLGNVEDTYDIVAITGIIPEWISPLVPTSLLPGARTNITLGITPPSCTLPQAIEFTAAARSLTDTTVNDSVAATLRVIDITPPEVTISSPLAQNYSYTEDVILNFTATDIGSCNASITAELNGVLVSADRIIDLFNFTLGGHTLIATAVDSAGNSATETVTFSVIDDIPPISSDNADEEWHTADISVTLTSDDEKSDIAEVHYKINYGPEVVATIDNDEIIGDPFIAKAIIDYEDDYNTLEYWSVDEWGNEEEHHFVDEIKLDKTRPVTEDDYDGEWHNEDTTIALASIDPVVEGAPSGVSETYYIVYEDGLPRSTRTLRVDGQPVITYEDDDNWLEYWSTDVAGNIEDHVVKKGIKVDKTPPEVNLWLDPVKDVYFSDESLPVAYKAYDQRVEGTPSNAVTVSFDIDGISVEDPRDIASWVGMHTLTITATDLAGNSASASVTFTAVLRAEINIDPDTLNLNSQGKWITGYIEFPSQYDVMSIDIDSVTLNGKINAESDSKYDFVSDPQPTDKDMDGVPEFMVKFDRGAVAKMLSPGDSVLLSVSGAFSAGRFEGTDSIRMIQEGKAVNKTRLKVQKHLIPKGSAKDGREEINVNMDIFTLGVEAKSVHVQEYIPEDFTYNTFGGVFLNTGLAWDVGDIKTGDKGRLKYTLVLPDVEEPTTYEFKTIVEYQTQEDLEILEVITYLTIDPKDVAILKKGNESKKLEKGKGYSKGHKGNKYSKGEGPKNKGHGKGKGKPDNPGKGGGGNDDDNNDNGNGGGKPDEPGKPDKPDKPGKS